METGSNFIRNRRRGGRRQRRWGDDDDDNNNWIASTVALQCCCHVASRLLFIAVYCCFYLFSSSFGKSVFVSIGFAFSRSMLNVCPLLFPTFSIIFFPYIDIGKWLGKRCIVYKPITTSGVMPSPQLHRQFHGRNPDQTCLPRLLCPPAQPHSVHVLKTLATFVLHPIQTVRHSLKESRAAAISSQPNHRAHSCKLQNCKTNISELRYCFLKVEIDPVIFMSN